MTTFTPVEKNMISKFQQDAWVVSTDDPGWIDQITSFDAFTKLVSNLGYTMDPILKEKRDTFFKHIEDANNPYNDTPKFEAIVFDENSDDWVQCDGGDFGYAWCANDSDGETTDLEYFFTFEDAIQRANELGCEAITKTINGYVVRKITIPIQGLTDGNTRPTMSWTKKVDYTPKHSRTTPVPDAKTAFKYYIENKDSQIDFLLQRSLMCQLL